jgi:FeS assembly SUF system protein
MTNDDIQESGAANGAEPRSDEAAEASTPSGSEAIRDAVMQALATVYDPEIPVDITALGLIYDVKVDEAGATEIRMTLTTPNCPAAEMLPPEVETKARDVEGVTSVDLQIVWDPPWSPDMMSEAAKLDLGLV